MSFLLSCAEENFYFLIMTHPQKCVVDDVVVVVVAIVVE